MFEQNQEKNMCLFKTVFPNPKINHMIKGSRKKNPPLMARPLRGGGGGW